MDDNDLMKTVAKVSKIKLLDGFKVRWNLVQELWAHDLFLPIQLLKKYKRIEFENKIESFRPFAPSIL